MRVRYNITKISTVFALAVLATTGAIWEVRRVRAFNPQPDPPGKFGMAGITRGQTMRLNVVNLSPPPEPEKQIPPPCRVVLSFRDAQGHPFTNSDGQPIRRVVELRAGESEFLDLNGDMFGGRQQTRTSRPHEFNCVPSCACSHRRPTLKGNSRPTPAAPRWRSSTTRAGARRSSPRASTLRPSPIASSSEFGDMYVECQVV